jgi:hypothetical protein
MVENISILKQPSKNYVIVITGDIVDNATHEAQIIEALDAINELKNADIIDKILFVGLDSTAEELHWYDSMLAQGEIGTRQLKELESILNKTEYSDLLK